MKSAVIKPINVIDNTELPEVSVNHMLTDGDPLEIKGEMYYVCNSADKNQTGSMEVGVIPLVIRNPAKVTNIVEYIKCLAIAHRKVQFKNKNGICDLNNCDEMIIS